MPGSQQELQTIADRNGSSTPPVPGRTEPPTAGPRSPVPRRRAHASPTPGSRQPLTGMKVLSPTQARSCAWDTHAHPGSVGDRKVVDAGRLPTMRVEPTVAAPGPVAVGGADRQDVEVGILWPAGKPVEWTAEVVLPPHGPVAAASLGVPASSNMATNPYPGQGLEKCLHHWLCEDGTYIGDFCSYG